MTPPIQLHNEFTNRPLLTQAYLQSVNKVPRLLLCPTPECPCTGTTSSWNTKYSWGIDLTCSDCHSTWTICKECALRSHHCTQKVKQRHHWTRHTTKKRSRSPDDSTNYDNTGDNEVIPDAPSRPLAMELSSIPVFDFSRPASSEFFKANMENNGLAHLCGRSAHHLTNTTAELHPAEVDMQMHTANLCLTLTHDQRSKLTTLLRSVVQCTTLQSMEIFHGKKKRPWMIEPIQDMALIRSQIMDGKYALLPNLPHPKIYVKDNHAYSLGSDCVADLLANGYEVDNIVRSETAPTPEEGRIISKTPRCQKLFDIQNRHEPMELEEIYLWVNEFSDDFENNNSIKANRDGVWIKTLTVCPPRYSTHRLSHTYPLAVGPKKASHESIEIALKIDMLEMAAGKIMYCKRRNKMIQTRTQPWASHWMASYVNDGSYEAEINVDPDARLRHRD